MVIGKKMFSGGQEGGEGGGGNRGNVWGELPTAGWTKERD